MRARAGGPGPRPEQAWPPGSAPRPPVGGPRSVRPSLRAGAFGQVAPNGMVTPRDVSRGTSSHVVSLARSEHCPMIRPGARGLVRHLDRPQRALPEARAVLAHAQTPTDPKSSGENSVCHVRVEMCGVGRTFHYRLPAVVVWREQQCLTAVL